MKESVETRMTILEKRVKTLEGYEMLAHCVECIQLLIHEINDILEARLGWRLQHGGDPLKEKLLDRVLRMNKPYEATSSVRLCGGYFDILPYAYDSDMHELLEDVEKEVISLYKKVSGFPTSAPTLREQLRWFSRLKEIQDHSLHHINQKQSNLDENPLKKVWEFCTGGSLAQHSSNIRNFLEEDGLNLIGMDEWKHLIEAGLSILEFSGGVKAEKSSEQTAYPIVTLALVERENHVAVVSKSRSTQAFKIAVKDLSYYPGKVVAVLGPHPKFGSGTRGIGRGAFCLQISGNIWFGVISKLKVITKQPYECVLIVGTSGGDEGKLTPVKFTIDPAADVVKIDLELPPPSSPRLHR